MTPAADLRHIDTWLFDLDYTLYPADCPLNDMVEQRMDAYIERLTGLQGQAVKDQRHNWYVTHGTTMHGLILEHGIDPHHFLADVQDVSVDCVSPDPAMRAALERLPGRRLVFTNAGEKYAHRVLKKLGIDDLFVDVFHIEAANFTPKPKPETFTRIVELHGVHAPSAAFFDDLARNLKPGAEIGMTTVQVGPHALENTDSFVHHRTDNLPGFLATAQLKA